MSPRVSSIGVVVVVVVVSVDSTMLFGAGDGVALVLRSVRLSCLFEHDARCRPTSFAPAGVDETMPASAESRTTKRTARGAKTTNGDSGGFSSSHAREQRRPRDLDSIVASRRQASVPVLSVRQKVQRRVRRTQFHESDAGGPVVRRLCVGR